MAGHRLPTTKAVLDLSAYRGEVWWAASRVRQREVAYAPLQIQRRVLRPFLKSCRRREDTLMGIMANLAKLGIAKKAYDEMKKPENQAKIKSALSSAKTKVQSRGGNTTRMP